ncbi:MAG: type II secretion system protein GspE [bacterium]|nr:MAG: type II secretion system protein GspE [bacterium]
MEETLKEISERLGLLFTEKLPSPEMAAEFVRQVPISFAKKTETAPVKTENGHVLLLTSRPLDHHALSDFRRIFAMPVKLIVAPPKLVAEYINRVYEISAGNVVDLLDEVKEPDLESIAQELEGPMDLLDTDEEAPIVRLLNSLLQQAIKRQASDIHIEVFSDSLAVRMRVDGILYSVLKPPKRIHPQLISRVKIMAGLDIAEKRLPQDGRISIKAAGRDIDLRVSTIPTTFGERVVMRLLDKSRNLLMLDQIGMADDQLKTMHSLLNLANGIVLVTGPTGSGKTTTLYSALGIIDTEKQNVMTVEDPVEYQVRGIGQMQVNSSIGLTFAGGLRSILRQDPDIIMVGEIRDNETASIAVQASLTGHLVFSTLHTNDSAGAITRLVDIGIEPFLIASSLVAVMAQRLVRVLCTSCRKLVVIETAEAQRLGVDLSSRPSPINVYQAVGCDECMKSGYRSRSGIYEFLSITDAIRSLIVQGADSNRIKQKGISEGMRTLRGDGLEKVFNHTTTLDEVLRVTDESPSGEIV